MRIEIKIYRGEYAPSPRRLAFRRSIALLLLLALVLAAPASAKYIGAGDVVFSTTLDSDVISGAVPITVSAGGEVGLNIAANRPIYNNGGYLDFRYAYPFGMNGSNELTLNGWNGTVDQVLIGTATGIAYRGINTTGAGMNTTETGNNFLTTAHAVRTSIDDSFRRVRYNSGASTAGVMTQVWNAITGAGVTDNSGKYYYCSMDVFMQVSNSGGERAYHCSLIYRDATWIYLYGTGTEQGGAIKRGIRINSTRFQFQNYNGTWSGDQDPGTNYVEISGWIYPKAFA